MISTTAVTTPAAAERPHRLLPLPRSVAYLAGEATIGDNHHPVIVAALHSPRPPDAVAESRPARSIA